MPEFENKGHFRCPILRGFTVYGKAERKGGKGEREEVEDVNVEVVRKH